MAKALFSEPHFQTEEAARALVEGIRWPTGPICGHCGETERRYATKRPGRWRCGNPECRKDFSVTTGMVMESSHIKLHIWLQAFHLAAASKKGFSAHQLHRELGITYKSAWFLHHRIMESMREGGLDLPPMSGPESIVETDETYFGPVKNPSMTRADGQLYNYGRRRRYAKGKYAGPANKRAIVTLVERGGKVRSFHVLRADKATVKKIIADNIAHEARLHTDESGLYKAKDIHLGGHDAVNHSKKEYVRYENGVAIHTNSAEGYFSIFKRGMKGVYQHCSEKHLHLHRYLAEFDFRYNRRAALGYTDEMRTIEAVQGAVGKRLQYQKPREA
jgi:transposase-like protein